MKYAKIAVNVVSAIAAFIAAILWYKASVVIIRPTDNDNGAEFSIKQHLFCKFDFSCFG